MKKIVIFIFLLVLTAVTALSATFKDVPINHWAYEAIERISSIGIVDGYPDGTFKGLENINRYQITLIISRTIDYIEQSVSPLTEKVAELDKKMKSINAPATVDLSSVNSKLSNLENSLNLNTSKINSLSSEVSELKNSYQLFSYTNNKVAQLEEIVKSIDTTSISNKINIVDSKTTENSEKITSLETQFADIQKSLTGLDFKNDINTIFTSVSNNSSALETLKTTVADNASGLSALTEKVSDLEKNVNLSNVNLNTKVSSAENKINLISTELESLKNSLSGKADKVDISSLNTSINSNKVAINETNSNLAEVKSVSDDNSSKLTDLGKKIDEVSKKADDAAVKAGTKSGFDFLDIVLAVIVSAGVSFAIHNFVPVP